MTVFELAAKITLDSAEYEKGLKGASKTANEWAKKLDKGINKLIKIGSVAATAAAAGFVAFGKAAVQTGMSFDKSMSQVAATMGKTTDEIQDLRKFALKMGSETAFSASQAADALNYMALAGYDSETAMAMLPGVLNLAAAGNMDLARASDMVTDSQSALGLSLDETNELIDKMAMASSKSNTSVEQLGDAILTVGGTAKNLNGGTTELATALGILADNGVKGAEGGTALRNILLSLTAPTDVAAKKLKELGVNVYDDQGHMRSLNDIFGDLDESMADLTEEQRMEALSTIFNNRDLKSAEALLANHGERWNELSGYIDNAAGSAQTMANTQLDNLNGDLTLMNSALEGAKIAFSDGITPSLRNIVQMLTRALSNPKTSKFLKEVGQQVGELAEKLAEWVSNALPKILRELKNGAPHIKAFGIAIAAVVLTVKALTNPIGALVTSLGLLGGAFAIAQLGAESYEPKLTAVQEAHKATAAAVSESIGKYNELEDARNKAIGQAHEEYEQSKELWEELNTIVDANGKIKEGYEERAEYIATKLRDDTGLAIEIVDGEIQEWEKLNGEIERSILLKRSEALIAANQPLYQEAVAGIEQLEEAISDRERDIAELAAAQANIAVKNAESVGTLTPEARDELYNSSYSRWQSWYSGLRDSELFGSDQSYTDLIAQREEYIDTIQRQEEAEGLLAEGTTDALKKIGDVFSKDLTKRWAYLKDVEEISDDELALLQDDLETARKTRERYLQDWKDDPTNGFLKRQYEKYNEQVNELEDLLAKVTGDATVKGASFAESLANGILSKLSNVSGAVDTINGVLAEVTGGHFVASSSASSHKSHAIGADYVPYNGYPAMLHRGEAVLTASEADEWRRGGGRGRQIVNNFSFHGVTQSDMDRVVAYVNRELVMG